MLAFGVSPCQRWRRWKGRCNVGEALRYKKQSTAAFHQPRCLAARYPKLFREPGLFAPTTHGWQSLGLLSRSEKPDRQELSLQPSDNQLSHDDQWADLERLSSSTLNWISLKVIWFPSTVLRRAWYCCMTWRISQAVIYFATTWDLWGSSLLIFKKPYRSKFMKFIFSTHSHRLILSWL